MPSPESVFYNCPLPSCSYAYEAHPNVSPEHLEKVLSEHAETHSASEFMAGIALYRTQVEECQDALASLSAAYATAQLQLRRSSPLDTSKGLLLPPEAQTEDLKLVGRRLPRPPS